VREKVREAQEKPQSAEGGMGCMQRHGVWEAQEVRRRRQRRGAGGAGGVVQAGEVAAQEAEVEVEAKKKWSGSVEARQVAYNVLGRWCRRRSTGSVRCGPLAAQRS
jgi:hypothetical protein